MVQCSASDCNHTYYRETCKFYRFPRNEEQKRRWIDLLRITDRVPTENARVCACHFVGNNKLGNRILKEPPGIAAVNEDSNSTTLRSVGRIVLKDDGAQQLPGSSQPLKVITRIPTPGTSAVREVRNSELLKNWLSVHVENSILKRKVNRLEKKLLQRESGTRHNRMKRADKEATDHSRVSSCHFTEGSKKNSPEMFKRNAEKKMFVSLEKRRKMVKNECGVDNSSQLKDKIVDQPSRSKEEILSSVEETIRKAEMELKKPIKIKASTDDVGCKIKKKRRKIVEKESATDNSSELKDKIVNQRSRNEVEVLLSVEKAIQKAEIDCSEIKKKRRKIVKKESPMDNSLLLKDKIVNQPSRSEEEILSSVEETIRKAEIDLNNPIKIKAATDDVSCNKKTKRRKVVEKECATDNSSQLKDKIVNQPSRSEEEVLLSVANTIRIAEIDLKIKVYPK